MRELPPLRRQLSAPMFRVLERSDGLTVEELADSLRTSAPMVRRCLRELVRLELAWDLTTYVATDEPWPTIECEVQARVLRQIRRQPRTCQELAEVMGPFGYERQGSPSHRGIIYAAVGRLRGAGHVATAGRVWLRTTRRARRCHDAG
tara:strand:- start:54 stop:497 length:444 start_codon:yes stop_codon:yes gene_type:complete